MERYRGRRVDRAQTGISFQPPFASRKICQPGVAPPRLKQLSPDGQAMTLQSCAVVTEQRFVSATAGVKGFSGLRISIPVTLRVGV